MIDEKELVKYLQKQTQIWAKCHKKHKKDNRLDYAMGCMLTCMNIEDWIQMNLAPKREKVKKTKVKYCRGPAHNAYVYG